MRTNLLERLRCGETLTWRQQLFLVVQLSIPAIFAQISSIIMQYIDASMVGRLGAADSASIGLMSSSTWLLNGLCTAASIGFNVQIAHRIGAGEEEEARRIARQGLLSVLLFSGALGAAGCAVSGFWPVLLGGEADICGKASAYFLVYSLFLPSLQINNAAGGMLQCSGNMRTPSVLHMLMCLFDIVFNFVFIFPTRTVQLAGMSFTVWGAGMGVAGAALGTGLAQLSTAFLMLWALLGRSESLKLRRGERFCFSGDVLKQAVRIALPVGFEQVVMCGAQIAQTRIVAPLGTIAIAANSFSVTAESLCYMPGYGIGTAATTVIGQSIGAGRKDLTRRLGFLITAFGAAVMTVSGALMYLGAPWMIGLLSPDAQIRALGTSVLRIEAFAEPMYGASIVAGGVFRGAGDTFVPSVLNFLSMWAVRIPLSSFLAPRYGLHGVWTAMCLELCVRGALFLVRMKGKRWQQARV